jgi:hypothetical protein
MRFDETSSPHAKLAVGARVDPMKKTCLLFAAAVILGCSGLASLRVKNLTEETIKVGVATTMDGKPVSSETDLAPRGLSGDVLAWFGNPPEYIEVAVEGGPTVRKVRLEPKDYTPRMRRGSSAASEYYLLVRPDSITVADALPLVHRPQLLIIAIVAFVVVAAAIALLKRRAHGLYGPGPRS